jgi:hypothetical protein
VSPAAAGCHGVPVDRRQRMGESVRPGMDWRGAGFDGINPDRAEIPEMPPVSDVDIHRMTLNRRALWRDQGRAAVVGSSVKLTAAEAWPISFIHKKGLS